MKPLNALKKLPLILIAMLLIVACSNDDDNTTPVVGTLNIVELALTDSNLSNLVAALQRANLATTLQSGTYTVFAPSNAAFETFLSDKGFASLNDVPVDVLTQVLLNHVIEGEFNSSSLSTGYNSTLATESSTSNKLSIYIDTSSGVKLNGISDVSTPNLQASNGVVHIVDKVIDLPTVVDFALADDTFSTLVAALTRNDLTFDYVTTLSTPNGTAPAPFTVFAPTNDAFGDLLTELGVASLNDIDEPTLKATLDLHAVAGANVLASALTDNMPVTTLGGEITANVTGGATLTDVNGRVSNITVTDVQAANGVIHVINKVVLPQLPKNIVGVALDTPELSDLVAALQAADGDLVNVLSGAGPFTVLAPNNAAFTAFLSENNFATLGDVPTDVLAQVLLNHVISGSTLMSTDLVGLGSGYASTEATGAGDNKMSIFFDTSSGVTFNGISTVDTPNIEATNGVIHIVDAVIGLPNIVDHAIANPNLTSLVDALTTGGNTTFTDLLSTPGDFTVFAPTNDAFTAFTNPNTNDLNDILSNHVVAGATATSSGLTNSYVKTAATFGATSNNLSLYINTDNGVTLNGMSTVAIPDIIASNGVIHAVDAIIDIPTVVTFATADPTFSTLVDALTTLTPATDFVATLSTANGTAPAPFTVFAPTNDAFAAITVPEEATLTQVLLHHVIGGMNVTSGDLNNPGNTMAPSLEGDDLTITLPGTGNNIADLTDGSGNSDIGIIAVDVQAGNGVIHVINKVAIPDLTN
ncbi:fasciclin domain-containing protein [Flavivirga algicola]|uniref:Fasciclin domain-containing protein n=1 Tax=Flavivirga algicola TaxID=2729136 RepID=A0ABX1RYI1_9FLAO|nr:fasciclin domain-containing protein [Flavivirga algicola]NMH88631.1 fasciclin domain-containing protein [Flavivirga algicola]